MQLRLHQRGCIKRELHPKSFCVTFGVQFAFPHSYKFVHLITSVYGNTQEQSHNAVTRTIVILLTSGLLSTNLADNSPLT